MDYKNADIANGPVLTDLSGADAAAVLDAAATLAAALQSGATLLPTADGQLVLPAGVGLDDIKVSGRDLIIQMPDGTQMVVPDGAIFVPQIIVDGVAVPPLNIAALLIGQEPQPAAGRPQSSGGNFADPVGDIGDPFALGDLLPPTQLAFPEPEEREIIPQLTDEEPTTIIITPDQPAGSVSATSSVQEAALPARGSEPSGSNSSSTAETTAGNIVFDTPDGLGSVTLNGTAIAAVGQTFVTPLGTLTITSIAPGNIGYTYTLTDNTTQPSSMDVFSVVVTDRDGDTASANLTINIVDDVPTARNDTDAVAAGSYAPQAGNVVTGVGTTSGAAGVDIQGADGAAVSGIRAGTTGNFAAVGTSINGQYGTLILGANGEYTYTRNPGTPGGVNDVFSYQITDGDGDTSTATLTISIADSGATVIVPTIGDGTTVSEVGLPERGTEPAGSEPELPVESTSGTITYVSPDGPATVQINGVTITAPGQTITTPTGVLTITSVADGAIGYTFVLADNTLGNTTSQTFTVTVTDVDGDVATAPLVINIVDDAPVARDNTATAAEDAPVVINVIANDTTGADDVNLATGVALGTAPAKGSVVYNADGTFTYTPTPGAEGTDSFTYSITDNDGDVSTATVTITLAEDSVPFVEIGGDRDVEEAGLPARGNEPAGSDAAANSETAAGTIFIGTGNDTVASLFINGVNVTSGGTVTGGAGILTVTLTEGVYSYSYTLTDNTSGDATTDSFAVVVTDSDGDVANADLVIAVADDVPTAVADTDSIAAGTYGPATGNVITDTETDGGKDTQGADGVTVTGVAAGEATATPGNPLDGQYGVLTLNSDGSYSYVRNAGTPGGVSDVFSYTITDGDGDTSTTTLTISIADSPATLDLPIKGEAGTLVDEAGLPAGSAAATDSETTTGTISYNAPDGPATVTIDGVAVTAIGQTFVGAFGTITITSIANGAVGYSYTLTTNTVGDTTFEDFAIVVTDQDGDNIPGTLVIDIVDDVPTARFDTDSVTEDDGEVPTADGNVITGAGGSDSNATDGVADVKGADGATVTAVAFGDTDGTLGGSTAGAYGTLMLNSDGSYTYVLDNFNPLVQGLDGNDTLTEIFAYTITDGDGDERSTTLTITINGSDDPISINGLNVEAPELIVDEDDLADGSDTTPEPLTQNGSFTVTGVDGIASVMIAGVEAFVGQTVTTAFGIFTITTISAPANGNATSITIGYSYTLTDNTAHANAVGENSLTETFAVVVTDTDGSSDSDTIEVQIVDDIPVAANDAATQIFENSPVTVNVLANDVRGADGVAVGTVALVAGSLVGTGTLANNNDGTFTYTPADGEIGTVTFDYIIVDADGDPSQATVTITLAADSVPVVKTTTSLTVDEDGLANANVDNVPLAVGETDSTESLTASGTAVVNFGSDVPADLLGSIILVDTPALDTQLQTLAGNAVVFALEAGTGDLVGKDGATEIIRIHITGAATGPAAGDVTYSYITTLSQPVKHTADGTENSDILTNVTFQVTDSDSDQTTGSFNVTVVDDIPTAVGETPVSVAEDAIGTVGGNLLANDSKGADGATLTSVTVGGVTTAISAVGTTIITPASGVGVYEFSANGDWTFNPSTGLNNATGVDASFTYIITDGDGDTATAAQPITVEDGAKPGDAGTIALALDDQNLVDGSTPAPPENDAATLTFVQGSDAISTIEFGTDLTQLNDDNLTWVRTDATHIVGTDTVSGVPVVTLELVRSGLTVTVTATLADNYDAHPGLGDILVDLGSVNVIATDTDGDTAFGTVTVTVSDDIPVVTLAATPVGTPTVDETNLGVSSGAVSFASTFVAAFNADGEAATGARLYELGVSATGADSGLVDVATGEAVLLRVNGSGAVEGYSATGGIVFTIAVAATTGDVTLTQLRAIDHPVETNPNDALGLAAANLVTLTLTIKDGDGDTDSETANIGNRFTFLDDGPSVDLAPPPALSIEVDETDLTVSAFGDLSTFITGIDYGSDQAGTTVYTLGVSSPNAPTALIDTETGENIVLTMNGPVVEGRTASTGELALIISIDSVTGIATFTQLRAVRHADDTNPNEATGLGMASLVTVTATVTDRDGDSATATAEVGGVFSILDDGPTVASNMLVQLDDDTLGGNPGGVGDVDVGIVLDNLSLSGSFGADTPGSYTFLTTGAPVGFQYIPSGSDILIQQFQGGIWVTVVTVELDPPSGTYSVTQNNNVLHAAGGNDETGIDFDLAYTVTDGDGDTIDGSLRINVNDDTPVANANTNAVDEGGIVTGNLLTDGIIDAFGADGAAVTVPTGGIIGIRAGSDTTIPATLGTTSVTTALGTLTLNADGSYTYDAKPNVVGATAVTDIFVYTIKDGDGDTSTATLEITINPVTLVAADQTKTVNEAALDTVLDPADLVVSTVVGSQPALGTETVTGTLPATLSSIAVTYTAQTVDTAYGQFVLNTNGTYKYTLKAQFDGPTLDNSSVTHPSVESFTYTVTDANGNTDTGTIIIDVIDDVPTARADTDSVSEETALIANGNVLTAAAVVTPDANATDGIADTAGADGATVTGIVFGTPAGPVAGGVGGVVSGTYGSLTLAAGGGYTYTLTNANATVQALGTGEFLLETFTYTVTDGDGDTSTTTLEIRINGTNDAPMITGATTAVSDEGLTGGNSDGIGSPTDTTSLATRSGSVTITDVDGDTQTVTLGLPTSGALASLGLTINWVLSNGGQTLTGSTTAGPVLVITIDNAGAFTVTQSRPIDHPTTSVEDVLGLVIPVSSFDGTATTTLPAGITISLEDDSPILVGTASNITLTGSALSGSGNFDYNIGGDARTSFSATNTDLAVVLTGNVGSTAIVNPVMTWASENANTATFNLSFQYDSDPTQTTDALVNETGTLVFDKVAGTYTVTLNQPIATFSTSQTSSTISSTGYDTAGGPQTEVVVSLLSSSPPLYVQFSGFESTSGGSGVPLTAGGNTAYANGETFSAAQTYVSISGSANGVASDTIQRGEVLDMDFFSTDPGSNTALATNTFATGMYLKIDNFGSEDLVIILKLADPNNPGVVLTTRAIVADTGDVYTQASGVPAGYNVTLDSNDGLIVIESNDYRIAGDPVQYVIVGAQLLSSTEGITGTGINLNRATGSTGGSTTTQNFGPSTTDTDVIKISDIGIIRPITSTQALRLNFDVTVKDSDGDTTSTTRLSVNPVTPPVVLDLDGDGAEFLSTAAGVTFDYAGDGAPDSTAWVGADDGLLAFDRNSDGIVNDGTEIVFGGNGLTDLQGLAANYDSNHDGLLTSADDNFALFGVWQDANSNGVTDAGEFRSLSDAGIVSIGLVSDGASYLAAGGEVAVAGQSAYTKTDGSTGIVADAAFLTAAAQSNQTKTYDQIRSGNLTTSIVAAALVGLAADDNNAAVRDIDSDVPGRVISEYATSNEALEPVSITETQRGDTIDAFAGQTDAVHRNSDVDTSLRVADEIEFATDTAFDAVSIVSDLLSDSIGPVNGQQGGNAFASNEMLMHAMLDITASAPAIPGNDNMAIPLGADDAVRHAMPDMMIDRLIDAFTDGPDGPVSNDEGRGIDGNDLLAGILDQVVAGDISASYSSTDMLASHVYDSTVANS